MLCYDYLPHNADVTDLAMSQFEQTAVSLTILRLGWPGFLQPSTPLRMGD